MDGFCGDETATSSFALVAYLPEPLGSFLARLRQDIEPGCVLRSHLTLLPPRPLGCSAEEAGQELETRLRNCAPFRVELGSVHVFRVSEVIHLDIGEGFDELVRLHELLNSGHAAFTESYKYHPHVTLAQNLSSADIVRAAALSEKRWQEYDRPRSFLLDRLTLVQNTPADGWSNLRDFELRAPVSA